MSARPELVIARLRRSSSTIEVPTAAVYNVEGERVTRIDFYLDQDQARRDVGLPT